MQTATFLVSHQTYFSHQNRNQEDCCGSGNEDGKRKFGSLESQILLVNHSISSQKKQKEEEAFQTQEAIRYAFLHTAETG